MSELTDALERILDFMQQYPTPQDIFLQPGISRTKIEELTNVLPFSLPHELYELYSWRNGDSSGRGRIAELEFLPIEKAINKYLSTLKDARASAVRSGRDPSETSWNSHWFPIFYVDSIEQGDYFILLNEEPQETSPVFCYDYKDWENLEPKFKYTSLTNMMLTIAEYYETGAYYLVEGESQYYLEKDDEKVETIRRKYNPEAWETYYDLFPEEIFYLPGY